MTLGYDHNIMWNYMNDLSSFDGNTGGSQWYEKDSAKVYNSLTSDGVPAAILDNVGLESAYTDLLPADTINHAIGKTATGRALDGTVSDMHNGSEAKYAVDGSESTYAQASENWAWMLDVDLGKLYNISKVRVCFHEDGFATEYDILTSENGTDWTTQVQVTNNTSGGWKEHSFAATDCRYVRLKMIKPDGPDQTGGQACVNEIETIGELGSETTPAPLPSPSPVPDPVLDVACQRDAVGRALDGSISDMHDGLEADKAIDGDSTTYAQASGNWAWMLDVDLEAVHNINKVKINYHPDGFSTEYDIQISLDGTNWTTVASVTGNESGGWKKHTFEPRAARYVRLKMIKPDGPDQTGGQAGVYDFEVYRYQNLEHGKDITARWLDGSLATMLTGHEADKAIDGDREGLTYAQPDGQYAYMLDLDLGGVFERLECAYVLFEESGFATDYDISISVDGSNWTTVKQVRDSTDLYARLPFTPTEGRYVRLKIIKPDGPDQTGGQACVTEFKVTEQRETGIILTTTTDGTTGVNKNNLHVISDLQYTFQEGDVIKYDVMLLNNETGIGGLDVSNNDSTFLRQYTWDDQNGIAGYIGDIRPKAYRKWYHRILPITTEMVGKTSNRWDIVFENDGSNKTFQVVYDNIVIKRNGLVVETVYKHGTPDSDRTDLKTYYDTCTIDTYGRYEWGRRYWCD